jgi:hypothetical protein
VSNQADGGAGRPGRRFLELLIVLVVLTAILVGAHPEALSPPHVRDFILSFGVMAPAVFTLLYLGAQNYIAGITRISTAQFFLATVLGIGPIIFVLAFLGDSLTDPGSFRFWLAAGIYLSVLLAPLLAAVILKKLGKTPLLTRISARDHSAAKPQPKPRCDRDPAPPGDTDAPQSSKGSSHLWHMSRNTQTMTPPRSA